MSSDFSDVMKKGSVKIKRKRLGVTSLLSRNFYLLWFICIRMITLKNIRVRKTRVFLKSPTWYVLGFYWVLG